ncbi:EF hand family protein [Trichomonas vaginalis G3]|uniref:EF hand family protein n=1 Tax=Trichomonas vaginalis (strain ATCC PRA-98 / G3) TaxID=412133 RepID=A2EWU3_TRIV3|nr:calcium ion binding [Trichomonas vaginalis G3]EAY02858.1 EF hand family protein [Trichomonas vaginalis G3]KAI5497372.1 calcium ion binding [Trichomonas vaginalis G3]|eukprot:XP_001315081.1 EF hand family protein [Trichomonas vaginalis G3]
MTEGLAKEAQIILHCPFDITDKESEELRQAFNLFDTDGAGIIKAEEIRVVLAVLGFNPTYEEVQDLIARHNKGKLSEIAFEEFSEMILDKISELRPRSDLKRAFRKLDADGNDAISLQDLQDVSELLGQDLSRDELREIIMNARDKSSQFDIHTKDVGQITEKQFIQAIKKLYS